VKIAVVGAGSIGGYLGALLAAAGDEVTFIARGANLDAIRANGMKVVTEDGREVIAKNVRVFSEMSEAGAQDTVLLTVKAHQVAAVAGDLHHLCDANTSIVTMQNGIPWWYFQRHGGPYEGTPVLAADPDGSIARAVDPARIIGSVVYPASVLEAPGVVHVVEGRRFALGELDGSTTPRIQAIAARLVAAGFKAPISDNLRAEIWLKFIGNLAFNPISALTHATLEGLTRYPLTRDLSFQMMSEGETIAKKLGITMRVGIEKRIAGAEKVGAHKTSMLQDVEAGRSLETEALIGSILEMAKLTKTSAPAIEAVYALVKLLNRVMLTEGGGVKLDKSEAKAA
jgi:2-dehydropantoate 2-reductase